MTSTLTLGLDFVLIWTLILGVGVFVYVLLDGFDLGVGILFGFAPDTAARNLVMNSVAPVWDGNETWLVLGSMGLLAAFPHRVRDHHPCRLFPHFVDVAVADLPRRVVRVPLSRQRASWLLGPRVQLWIAAGDVHAGDRARRLRPGVHHRRDRVYRNQSRLLHPVQHSGRHQPGVRLCAARRRLAGAQDGGRYAILGARAGPKGISRRGRRYSFGQHLDHGRVPRHPQPLVLVARHRAADAGADRHRCGGLAGVAQPQSDRFRSRTIHWCRRAVCAVLSRHRHQPVPVCGAARIDAVAGGGCPHLRRCSC